LASRLRKLAVLGFVIECLANRLGSSAAAERSA